MLRFNAEKDTPYITVEIDANNDRIIQWYGANDKKPDKRNMQEWLDHYMKWLKDKENLSKADNMTTEQLLAVAAI